MPLLHAVNDPIDNIGEPRSTAERLANGGGPAQAQLAVLMGQHDTGLRRLAYRLLEDHDEMDDVLQDVYIKAYRALSGFRGDADTGTWLYRITYNACIDRLRRRSAHPSVPLDDLLDRSVRPRRDIDPGEIVTGKQQLGRALAELSPEHRATVLLVDAEGYSHEEAAAILGVREGTVASRLHYARVALRRALTE